MLLKFLRCEPANSNCTAFTSAQPTVAPSMETGSVSCPSSTLPTPTDPAPVHRGPTVANRWGAWANLRNWRAAHEAKLKDQIRAVEESYCSAQLLALAALSDWTADHAYAPRRVEVDKREDLIKGLANFVAKKLSDDYLAKFGRHIPKLELSISLPSAIARVLDPPNLDNWTEVIKGSVDDVDANETNRDMDDDVSMRATDKRRIRTANFTQATIEGILAGNEEGILARRRFCRRDRDRASISTTKRAAFSIHLRRRSSQISL